MGQYEFCYHDQLIFFDKHVFLCLYGYVGVRVTFLG
jgi:hypothetical protein